MTEDFLHFIWKNRLFRSNELRTTQGIPLEIESIGQPNHDAGPDFFNARIKIGDTVWAGNVEIHQRSSHWLQHGHHQDASYNNVILHVVGEADVPIRINGQDLPCLEISYPDHLRKNYETLLKAQTWVPCDQSIRLFDPIHLRMWFSALMIERLQMKTEEIQKRLEQNQNNWNETFYQLLARNFGMKTNAQPFEMLARSLPLSVLSKHKNDLFQIEALLFGQSGLLNEPLPGNDYLLVLRDEYSYLCKKYKLHPIEKRLWKFLRLRPVNFPTIRIAQLAALINRSSALFSHIIETPDIDQIRKLFDVQASEYWDNHYRFDKFSGENKPKKLGETIFHSIVINTLSPLLFLYGEHQSKPELKDRVLDFLEQLPPESNNIISGWQNLGIHPENAFETQALIQLKNTYCENKKCLNCPMGAKIIARNNKIAHGTAGQ